MMSSKRYCPTCQTIIRGRSDKKFCSVKCKSQYHHAQQKHSDRGTEVIDKILHRNRAILIELMGDYKQKQISILELEKRKFNFNHITRYTINSKGKTYNWVYDYSWMQFSSGLVLINKRGNY